MHESRLTLDYRSLPVPNLSSIVGKKENGAEAAIFQQILQISDKFLILPLNYTKIKHLQPQI